MAKLNFKIISYILGVLMLCNGGFILLSSLFGFWYQDGSGLAILKAGLLTAFIGGLPMLLFRNHDQKMNKREGYLIVTLGWVFMTFTGTLPYLFSGAIPTLTDAFFETMSGYTTTGSSILTDIESLPKGVLIWRSMTHWIGGMGMIVLAIAILPLLGIGGMQLFAAEAPGPSADKLHPRITDTAKRLWYIYVLYTVVETILLYCAGMNFFDAFNHALATLSTGGFSTKNASVAFWNDSPIIQYIIILFMYLAGMNFVLSYFGFKGKFSKIFEDREFRWYTGLVLGFTALSTTLIYYYADISQSSITHPMVWGRLESCFRHAIFQVLAVITTTGFVTADFSLWTPFLKVLFFGMMFLGGSAGSTSGGVKVVRHLIMIKNALLEFKRTLHPNAVLPVRYNNKVVSKEIVYNILGFFSIYIVCYIIGALGLGVLGLDFETAIAGAATSLGNVGPGLGKLSPVDNFAWLPDTGKWWCSFLMLIGRLELFTVLIILTPFFWRNK